MEPPCRAGSQVTLAGCHLVDLSSDKLSQSDEGPRVQGVRMIVLSWCGEEFRQLVKEGISYPFLQGGISVVY